MSWLLGRFGGSSDSDGGGGGETEGQPDGNDTAQNTKSTGKNNVSESDHPLQYGWVVLARVAAGFHSIIISCFAGCNLALPSCRRVING